MHINFILIFLILSFFTILIIFASFCKNKFFSYIESDMLANTTADKIANDILEKYGVISDDQSNSINDSDSDISESDDCNELNHMDEQGTSSGRVYESIREPSYRVYESCSETDVNTEDFNNNITYPNILSAEGTFVYGYNKNDLKLYLSNDLLKSKSYSACISAAYKATEMCENISKSFSNRIISIITFVPNIINQISWFFCLLYLFGFSLIPSNIITVCGIIFIVSLLLSCLRFIYCVDISNITFHNLEELMYIDETEKDSVKHLLSLLAISESTRSFVFIKWFMNKILGYRV